MTPKICPRCGAPMPVRALLETARQEHDELLRLRAQVAHAVDTIEKLLVLGEVTITSVRTP